MGCCTTVYDYVYCRDVIGDDNDFVFEEFVRLRVAGVEEGNETEAWQLTAALALHQQDSMCIVNTWPSFIA